MSDYIIKRSESFYQSLESIQYNAAIAITGRIWRTSQRSFFENWNWKPSDQEVG